MPRVIPVYRAFEPVRSLMPARALLGLAVLTLAGSAHAADPPPVLRILSEHIRASVPQRDLEQVRAEYAAAQRGAGIAPPSIALASLSGSPELWRTEFHPSFAAMEDAINTMAQSGTLQQIDARAGELIDDRHTFIAIYREGLSLQTQQALAVLPRARFMLIRKVEVQTGRERDFAQSFRTLLAASDRAGLDQPVLAYQIFSGGSRSTYLFLQPLRSLATVDTMMPDIGKTYESLGAEGASKLHTTLTDTVLSDERLLFRVAPALSVPPKEFVDIDHDFWAPGTGQ
jgi:hypothetical protein